jgi:hypothetical protein
MWVYDELSYQSLDMRRTAEQCCQLAAVHQKHVKQSVSDSQTLPFRPACRMRLFRRTAAVVQTHHTPDIHHDQFTVNKPAASF